MPKVTFIPYAENEKATKRPDRVEKLKKRFTHQESVVKSCLLKYIQGDDEQKQKVKQAIKDRVMSYSQRVNMASLILLGILKELFNGVEDILTVELPDFTDQTFIRQLLLGIKDATKPFLIIKSYQERFPQLFRDIQRFKTDRNIFTAGAIKYGTNLKNSLWVNFPSRVKTFVKRFQELEKLTDDERVMMWYQIMGWDSSRLDVGNIFPMRECVWRAVTEHRRILGVETVTKEWIEHKDNYSTLLKYNVLLNRYYQEQNLSTFNIIPVCTVRSHFITIDSTSLHGVMKDAELIDCGEKEFLSLKDEHWKSLLQLDRLRGAVSEFTGTIETDGVALCTHFQKPKPPKQDGKKKKDTFTYSEKLHRVVGVDTGRVNIFYAAEILDDGTIKKYILSRNQYYTRIGAFRSRGLTQGWNNGIQDNLVALSGASTKGVDLVKHQEFLNTYLAHYDILWEEYTKERWSRNRLSLYAGKQRVWDEVFNEMIQSGNPNKQLVISYGASKFSPTGPGELSVPTSQVYKETVKRFKQNVLLTDEYRSTKVYYRDNSILQSVKSRQRSRVLRGLLWCRSTTNNRHHFVDRDLNAALNIRRCLMGERPDIMTRSPNHRRLPNVIGKTINR